MNNTSNTDTQTEISEETKIKLQPNYWRDQKGYKRKYQFREKRNYQVSEICILFSLLNEYFDIELSKTIVRKSKLTNRLLRLKRLTKENDVINVEELINRRCRENLNQI